LPPRRHIGALDIRDILFPAELQQLDWLRVDRSADPARLASVCHPAGWSIHSRRWQV